MASQPVTGGRSRRHDRRYFGRLEQEDYRLKKHYGRKKQRRSCRMLLPLWPAVMPRRRHRPLLLPPLARPSLYSPTRPVILRRRQPQHATAPEPVNPRTPLRLRLDRRIFNGSCLFRPRPRRRPPPCGLGSLTVRGAPPSCVVNVVNNREEQGDDCTWRV